ncbi:MAG: AAA family ATPase [Clostridia bacterium]|nr:AAA family ATPase [Clostridia bacterium]
MLSELYIENVAVIEKACVDFGPGLNVFTGETGAGKSILINSINSIMGKRINKDCVRNGTDTALIIAKFSDFDDKLKDKIKNIEVIPDEDGAVILQRTISNKGRTGCKINSRPSTAAQMKSLSDYIISIHGQNDNYDLNSKEMQLGYIDELADNDEELKAYREKFRQVITVRKNIRKLSENEESKKRESEILEYQINEIESANLEENELEKLLEKKKRFANSEKIAQAFTKISAAANRSENGIGISDILDEINMNLRQLALFLPQADEIIKRFESAYYEINDCIDEIEDLQEENFFDAQESERVEKRVDEIYKLCSKYGKSTREILDFKDDCKCKLEQIKTSDETILKLKEEYKSGVSLLKDYAQRISEKRKKAALNFSKKVMQELSFLNMPDTTFKVDFEKSSLTKDGCDNISFMLSTNKGEPLKPIEKTASGGELSRIMLAIKSVIANKEQIPTLIFDEIDTGIS